MKEEILWISFFFLVIGEIIMNDVIKEKLDKLPQKPGEYMMKDATGTIIYIGKAKRLRTRGSQYFREGVPHDAKVSFVPSEKPFVSHFSVV